jgi:Na+/H+ antiporter NhaD/arsenite permease-like protein
MKQTKKTKNSLFKQIPVKFNFWRYLINFWSLFFFVAIIADLHQGNALADSLNVIAVLYVSILAIYVGDKEFERWYDKHLEKHPGEAFVIIWSLIVFCLLMCSLAFREYYQIPNSVISSYIAVLTILVVTNKSKQMYKIKRRKKK